MVNSSPVQVSNVEVGTILYHWYYGPMKIVKIEEYHGDHQTILMDVIDQRVKSDGTAWDAYRFIGPKKFRTYDVNRTFLFENKADIVRSTGPASAEEFDQLLHPFFTEVLTAGEQAELQSKKSSFVAEQKNYEQEKQGLLQGLDVLNRVVELHEEHKQLLDAVAKSQDTAGFRFPTSTDYASEISSLLYEHFKSENLTAQSDGKAIVDFSEKLNLLYAKHNQKIAKAELEIERAKSQLFLIDERSKSTKASTYAWVGSNESI